MTKSLDCWKKLETNSFKNRHIRNSKYIYMILFSGWYVIYAECHYINTIIYLIMILFTQRFSNCISTVFGCLAKYLEIKNCSKKSQFSNWMELKEALFMQIKKLLIIIYKQHWHLWWKNICPSFTITYIDWLIDWLIDLHIYLFIIIYLSLLFYLILLIYYLLLLINYLFILLIFFLCAWLEIGYFNYNIIFSNAKFYQPTDIFISKELLFVLSKESLLFHRFRFLFSFYCSFNSPKYLSICKFIVSMTYNVRDFFLSDSLIFIRDLYTF